MKYLVGIILILGVVACGEEEQPEQVVGYKQEKNRNKVSLDETIPLHKSWTKEDNIAIENYASRRHWDLKHTGTGVRYYIYEKVDDDSPQPKEGNFVTVEYVVTLLDGTVCYSSDENGPATFKVEKDDVESGLHEAVKKLKVGERAKVVLPPHRAHGLLGDSGKIPPQSVVIYDLKLLSIE